MPLMKMFSVVAVAAWFSGLSCLGASYPEPLSTARDIESASPDLEAIDIVSLPLEDYPLLAKFTKVKRIGFDSREGTFATNDKLKALALVGLTNVAFVTLTNCRLITDAGIAALCRVASLKGLGLEGTAITDAACGEMSSHRGLTGVNVANCTKITIGGLAALAASENLRDFSFSSDRLTQAQVLDLIGSFKNINWCEVVDPQGKLDPKVLKAKAAEKGIHLAVRRTGALQDKYGTPD